MESETVFRAEIETNQGHDWVVVKAERGYGSMVEIVFEGRDPAIVTIRLIQSEDVRAIGDALLKAADALDAAAALPAEGEAR